MNFPERLRSLRLSAGITVKAASRNAGVSVTSWHHWEAGRKTPLLVRGPQIASAIGVPVGALFNDRVIAEVVVGDATRQQIRKEGRTVAAEAAQRLAAQLEPAIYDAATRKPADTRPGARAKPRRTRAETLADLKASTRAVKHPSLRTIE